MVFPHPICCSGAEGQCSLFLILRLTWVRPLVGSTRDGRMIAKLFIGLERGKGMLLLIVEGGEKVCVRCRRWGERFWLVLKGRRKVFVG